MSSRLSKPLASAVPCYADADAGRATTALPMAAVSDPWAVMEERPSPKAPSGPASPPTGPRASSGAAAPMDVDDALTTASSTNARGKNKDKSIARIPPSELPAGKVIATWPLVP